MKRCSYCGAEYPDDLSECPIDHTSMGPPSKSAGGDEKNEEDLRSRTRIAYRIGGIILIVLAGASYVLSARDFAAGDIDIGYNYKGVRNISNFKYRLAFVLGVAGAACVLRSFAGNDGKKNDKDSS